ncbi:hypothetical protein HOY82DRAFT_604865 [Tuber indicum]|nr:hypothetical protein HOY82DRAFT_604865 [Tuber indicum]
MSLSTLEMSLLATFDKIWETEDFSFSDIESEIFLFDNQPLISTPSNAGSNTTAPADTNTPQVGNIEKTNQETKAKQAPKKRTTCGRELPIPTTNLPPRKRAKTDAEKEQRRIERVLRNRAAAQSSRARKQKEEETLRTETASLSASNIELKAELLAQREANSVLRRELETVKQTLKSYEEYLKVESKEAPEPNTEEDKNLFRWLLQDTPAPASAMDPRTLAWRCSLAQRESIMEQEYLS